MGVVLPGLSINQEMSDQDVASHPCCSVVFLRHAEGLAFIMCPEDDGSHSLQEVSLMKMLDLIQMIWVKTFDLQHCPCSHVRNSESGRNSLCADARPVLYCMKNLPHFSTFLV
ncbi:hypothetical protein O3P69_020581 [Scylla paramamosain]|uniref:Uncharacterized protein n=1 Tax=Scylla paramamosain TaxID=85552 RepID=A0AAW0TLQ4_SCYPA